MRPSALFVGAILIGATLTGCGNAPLNAAGSASDLPKVRDLTDVEIPSPADPGATPAPGEPRNYNVDSMSAQDTYGLYYGYSGPWFSQLQWDRGITVLDRSVGSQRGATWGVFLLARNDTLADVGTITVTATLLDEKGIELRQVSSNSSVPDARPGEPVPVSLSADVPASQVASVRYSAAASAPQDLERGLSIERLQELPYGEREAVKTDWWTDSGSPPYPYVSLLFAKNLAGGARTDDHVVVAWYDKAGQVDAVSNGANALTEGRSQDQLAYGQEFVVSNDNQGDAPLMSGSQPMYWVWAR